MSTTLKIQMAVAKLLDDYRARYAPAPRATPPWLTTEQRARRVALQAKDAAQSKAWDVTLVAAISKAVDIGINEHLKADHGDEAAKRNNPLMGICAPFTPPDPHELWFGGKKIVFDDPKERLDETPRVKAETMESFRANPASRHWENSYTRKVIAAVPRAYRGAKAVSDALHLLKDYWFTQHEVFEQRDKLREEVKAAIGKQSETDRAAINDRDKQIAALRHQVGDLTATVEAMQTELGETNEWLTYVNTQKLQAEAALRNTEQVLMDVRELPRRLKHAYNSEPASVFQALLGSIK